MGKWSYGVILDAGSSGTRLHVYKWLKPDKARAKANAKDLRSLPRLETRKDWTVKKKPGISTFNDKPEEVGGYLEELFSHALNIVEKDEVANTPIFLLATAGMRLLQPYEQSAILKEVCAYAQSHTNFHLPDCDIHIQIIPGETEGLYGWIAANYLLQSFDEPEHHDHGKDHHTYGFLDMGGASAQIAFAPNTTEAEKHANDLTLLRLRTMDGLPQEYRVFVTTWLEFGVNKARERYVNKLLDYTEHKLAEVPDPCLPQGLNVTTQGKPITEGSEEWLGRKPHLLGTGIFSECLHATYPLLEKDAPCPDKPCLVHGVHTPALDFDVNHFVGVSEYWHTTHQVFEMAHTDRGYDFKSYQAMVDQFCSQPWGAIQSGQVGKQWGKKVDEETAREVCFKASWLINMLHEGIGVPRVGIEQSSHNTTLKHSKSKGDKHGLSASSKSTTDYVDPFQAVDKIDGVEVSWTLGKMILYASSQVPPAPKAMTDPYLVGFGPNKLNVETTPDWHPAGGSSLPSHPSSSTNHTTSPLPPKDRPDPLSTDSPRRIPGLLLFALILLLATYLLLGRTRRSSLLAKLRRAPPPPTKRHRAGPLKLVTQVFGSHRDPRYERVAATDLDDPAAFELGDVEEAYSDESPVSASAMRPSIFGGVMIEY
ncbi:hypothetical protein P152DRAFT_263422 [Eremomyces bilateralis CBS 781.70]|uniref:Nucleoside diphosphatase n=1 Tax=Eremomyces bilateralis CBS 781.70 TaxID=1392243 RepID=A0A6G1G7Z0_9PEZI|nr:uncharacterized protein P152DRAFT_263422 [Eremomyces bilateralis CBS 781.70]KAF1814187.1 hypothetical protein P152DRAFT_263422 [Eremomyces bilateralis CBS 781.70]